MVNKPTCTAQCVEGCSARERPCIYTFTSVRDKPSKDKINNFHCLSTDKRVPFKTLAIAEDHNNG